MSDTQIIDLDEPEPVTARAPWRPGSLAIVVTPLVVAALVVSLAVPRLADRLGAQPAPLSTPEPTPGGGWLTFPTPNVTTPIVTPLGASRETGNAEVLETQHWTARGPSYPVRGDVAEAVLYGFAYVIGGTGTLEDGRRVYRYDLRTGERERVADLPISLDHAMAATLNDRIYVFGGFAFAQASARVFSLGANDFSWTEHSLMPQGRAAGGAVALNGRIWLVGGLGGNGSWITDVWSWDGSGRWSTGLARIPTPRDHLAVGTYRGSICAAGGTGGDRAFECYEPVRDEWTRRPDLRSPVIGGRAAEAAGWFWVIGAFVHVFAVDHWHFGPRPPAMRAGHALVVVDGTLYLIENGLAAYAQVETLHPEP